jgi:hypothetical protein
MSKKILKQAREQLDDDMGDDDDDVVGDDGAGPADYQAQQGSDEEGDLHEAEGHGEAFEGEMDAYERHLVRAVGGLLLLCGFQCLLVLALMCGQGIAPEDEAALQMFMSKEPGKRLNLGELIMSKIREKETEIASQMSGECFSFSRAVPLFLQLQHSQS